MRLGINDLLLGMGEIARARGIAGYRITWKAKAPNKLVLTLVIEASKSPARSPLGARAAAPESGRGRVACDGLQQA